MISGTGGSGLKASLAIFVGGLVVGIVATMVVPNLIAPYLPEAIVGADAQVYGVVTGKRVEADRVLLTLPTDEGTVLATFTDGLPEIDLMINEGDSVTLEVDEYAPFVENPKIVRVVTLSSPLNSQPNQNDAGMDSSGAASPDGATARSESAEMMVDSIVVPADTSGG